MLNAQVASARVADRNDRAQRAAVNRQLLASIQPDEQSHRIGRRGPRIWSRAAAPTPIQA